MHWWILPILVFVAGFGLGLRSLHRDTPGPFYGLRASVIFYGGCVAALSLTIGHYL